MAKNPFHQLDVIRKSSQHGKKITDCYRLMYKKELWFKAYTKLYPNAGNLTKRTPEETIDRFSLQRMVEIIEQLKNGTFRFTSVKRVYTSKIKGNKNLSEILDLKEKLVQEVMRMILENVYEPIFSDNSHGFRGGRNSHTALSQIKNTWNGATWCIKGDIKDSFEYIDHTVLLNLISKRINDHRFLSLIHNALISGVMENWTYHRTYSGTPQGGIISPLLANIYLHEFDLFMEQKIENFDKDKKGEEFMKVCSESTVFKNVKRLDDRNGHQSWDDRESLIKTIKKTERKQTVFPSITPVDIDDNRMKYVRYAGDFVIGIAGSKGSARVVKEMIKDFFKQELHLELSEEKTFITHLKKSIPFLGYEFRKWGEAKTTKFLSENYKHPFKERTQPGGIKLEIPERRMKELAQSNGYGSLDNFKMIHRAKLINNSELEILYAYNAELKEIANYYKLAGNYHHLDKLFYLAEGSFVKTIANKRRSTSRRVAASMRTPIQGVLCLVKEDTKGNKKIHSFVKRKDLPKHEAGAIKAGFPEIDSSVNTMKYSGRNAY